MVRIGGRAMRDIRKAPFCWQSVLATRMLRRRFEGKERTTALAIYQALTEVANEKREQSFRASRAQIADYAGVSKPTLDRYAGLFTEMGLLTVARQKKGAENLPNLWTLVEPVDEVAKPVDRGGSKANRPPIQQPTLVEGPDATTEPDSSLLSEPNSQERDPVDRVFAVWVDLEKPKNPALTPSRKRMIEKALKEADAEECIMALLGRRAWLDANRGADAKLELSSVFQSRPGGSPLREQIDFYISQAPVNQTALQPSGFPSASKSRIDAEIATVREASDDPNSYQLQKLAERSVEWLREHGIGVSYDEHGQPTFEPLTSPLKDVVATEAGEGGKLEDAVPNLERSL